MRSDSRCPRLPHGRHLEESFASFAAPTTQRENGVPFSPLTCLWLIALQTCFGASVSSWAIFAIVATHWLNGVPF
jgi:hypothetical protein